MKKRGRKTSGASLLNKEHPEVIELWNIVFVEYYYFDDQDKLSPLPKELRSVDTGMGLERLTAAVNGHVSTYCTNLFLPFLEYINENAPMQYMDDYRERDVAMRVMADHLKACAFAIRDGVMPSNNKEGYVIRHLLRRAVYYGYDTLHIYKPFLCNMLSGS